MACRVPSRQFRRPGGPLEWERGAVCVRGGAGRLPHLGVHTRLLGAQMQACLLY